MQINTWTSQNNFSSSLQVCISFLVSFLLSRSFIIYLVWGGLITLIPWLQIAGEFYMCVVIFKKWCFQNGYWTWLLLIFTNISSHERPFHRQSLLQIITNDPVQLLSQSSGLIYLEKKNIHETTETDTGQLRSSYSARHLIQLQLPIENPILSQVRSKHWRTLQLNI